MSVNIDIFICGGHGCCRWAALVCWMFVQWLSSSCSYVLGVSNCVVWASACSESKLCMYHQMLLFRVCRQCSWCPFEVEAMQLLAKYHSKLWDYGWWPSIVQLPGFAVSALYPNGLGYITCVKHPRTLIRTSAALFLFNMTRKIVSEMTYNVSMGTLNPTIPYHIFFSNRVTIRLITEKKFCKQFLQT